MTTALLVIAIAALVIWCPEALFVLTLNAGVFKAAPQLASLQSTIDLTLGLELACTAGIVVRIVRGRTPVVPPSAKALIPFLLFAAIVTTSLAYTTSPAYGTAKVVRFLSVTSFCFLAPQFLLQRPRRFTIFFWSWGLFSLLVAASSLSASTASQFREAFGSSGYLLLGSFSAQSAIIALYLLSRRESYFCQGLALSLAGLNLTCALLSGARGSPLMLLVTAGGAIAVAGIGQLFHPTLKRRQLRTIVKAVLLLVVLGVGLVALWPLFSTFSARTGALYRAPGDVEGLRMDMLQSALSLLYQKPLGLGVGGFSMYYFQFDSPRGGFVHNIFLEISSELGWGGLLAFGALCCYSLVPVARRLRRMQPAWKRIGRITMGLAFYLLLLFQIQGDLNDARHLFAWLGTLAAVAQFSRVRKLRIANVTFSGPVSDSEEHVGQECQG